MRKIFLSLLILAGTFTAIHAQQTVKKADRLQGVHPNNESVAANGITNSQYEELIENSYKVNFRSYAFSELNLNSEEITNLTPVYMEYMNEKSDLIDRRRRLVEAYREEMKEDDTVKDENEETADFIENYWETDIAEMELKKDYFDKFEDHIPYQKAVRFFLLESEVQERLKRAQIVGLVPVLTFKPETSFSQNIEVRNYNNWMLNVDGQVDVNHEYTSQGLTQLVKTVESLAAAADVEIENFEMHKQSVMKVTKELQKDWTATNHADITRDAFVTVAAMFEQLSTKEPFTGRTATVMQLKDAAKMIKDKILLTDQADHVYNFFNQAEKTVNTLARSADLEWKDKWMNVRR